MGGKSSRSHRTEYQQKGDNLEMRVESLFRRMGKFRVKRHVMLRDGFGNLSEIDVVYGIFRRRYVECKAYHEGHHVPLSDVAKFKEVLQLNGISPRRGIFVTTSDYVPRAKTIGIKVINGTQLARLEKLWPLYRVGRLVGTTIAALTALFVIDDFQDSKQRIDRYVLDRANLQYWEVIWETAPERATRKVQKAESWWRQQLDKIKI